LSAGATGEKETVTTGSSYGKNVNGGKSHQAEFYTALSWVAEQCKNSLLSAI